MAENEKVFNTRIQLRYDTYEHWMAEGVNPELKRGEIAICEVPVAQTVDGITSVRPQILMKVGPGNFKNLDWTNAKAADVYEWAKQANLPIANGDDQTVENYAEGNVIASIYWDADNKSIKYTTATVATSEGLADLTAAVETIKDHDSVDSFKDVMDEMAKKLDLSGGAMTGSIAMSGNKVTGLDTPTADADAATKKYVDDAAAAVDNRVTTLIGEDINKSVRAIANEELAAQLIAEGAQESLDTLAEIAAWIQSHPDDAAAMNEAIVALQNKVDTGDKTVSVYVTDAITALKIGDYAKAADLTALAGRVATAETEIAKKANTTDLDNYVLKSAAAGYDDILTKTSAATLYQPVGNYQPAGDYAPAGNYKTQQENKSFSGSATKTLTEITQNANGEINATFEDIDFSSHNHAINTLTQTDWVIWDCGGADLSGVTFS